MSTIRRATEKARREKERRRAGGQGTASQPILRPVPVPLRDEGNQARSSELAEVTTTPSQTERADATGLELSDGEFGPPDEHLVCLVSPDSIESEHYQTIRFTLEQQRQANGATVIAVSSPSSAEGKTLTTLNLAGSLARGKDRRVLVIDGDLRKPSVARYLGMRSPGSGLSGALVRETSKLSDVVRFHRLHNLAILPSGDVSNVPYELFTSPQMKILLEDARRHFDYVFIDLPPMLFPECRVIEQYVDGFVIVVAAHRTSSTHFRDALEQFDRSKILGVIFNSDTQRKSLQSYYKYGYGRS